MTGCANRDLTRCNGREQRGRRGSSGGFGEGVDDAVNDFLYQHLVVAFTHHADDRFGTRRTHDQAAVAIETGFAVLDGVADFGAFNPSRPEHLRSRATVRNKAALSASSLRITLAGSASQKSLGRLVCVRPPPGENVT